MRYYLDEDLSEKIAEIARCRGLDVLSARECGNKGLRDDQQLSFAAGEGRCLVTRNRDDFLEATTRFFERGWPHAGVLVISRSLPSNRFAAVAATLLDYERHHPEGISAYTIDFLHPIDPHFA